MRRRVGDRASDRAGHTGRTDRTGHTESELGDQRPAPSDAAQAPPDSDLPSAIPRRSRVRPGPLIAIGFAALIALLIVANGIHPQNGTPHIVGGPSSAGPPTTTVADPKAPLRLPAAIGTLKLGHDSDSRQLTELFDGIATTDLQLTAVKVSGAYLDPTYKHSAGRTIMIAGTYSTPAPGAPSPSTDELAALLYTALDDPQVSNTQTFDPGPRGGSLQCGNVSFGTICVWDDATVEVGVAFTGTSSSAIALADVAMTRQIRDAIER